jgi:hypothetical protein
MNLKQLSMIPLLMLCVSCASIVSKSIWPVTINSTPSQANLIIKNRKGVEVFNGKTPASPNLKSSGGFFRRAKYTLVLSTEGYDTLTVPLNATINGWYFGNFAFGGVIGFLIVDPATGAMYKIQDPHLTLALSKSTAVLNLKEINIINLDQLPPDITANLVRIN